MYKLQGQQTTGFVLIFQWEPPLLWFPSWAMRAIAALASSKKGATSPHAWLGTRVPWGAGGRDIRSDGDGFTFRPFFCPTTQRAGKQSDSGGWARLGAGGQLAACPPFALCMAFPRRLNLRHLLLHPILISLAGLPRHISVDLRQLATHPLCQGISQQAKPPPCS